MILKLTIWKRYEDGKAVEKVRLVHIDGQLTNKEDLDRLITLRDSGQDWQWDKLYTREFEKCDQ